MGSQSAQLADLEGDVLQAVRKTPKSVRLQPLRSLWHQESDCTRSIGSRAANSRSRRTVSFTSPV